MSQEIIETTIEHDILQTGLYTIRTIPSLQLVGRNIVEDDSNDPKGVYGQPLGVPLNDNTTFLLRRAGGESFYVACGRDRGHVVELEGRVVAVFEEELDDPFEYRVNIRWVIQRQPQHGDDVYT